MERVRRDKVNADSDFNLAKHVCHVHQYNRSVRFAAAA